MARRNIYMLLTNKTIKTETFMLKNKYQHLYNLV